MYSQQRSLDFTGFDFPQPARVKITWQTDKKQLVFEPVQMTGKRNPVNDLGIEVVQFPQDDVYMRNTQREIHRVLRLMHDEVKSAWQLRRLI